MSGNAPSTRRQHDNVPLEGAIHVINQAVGATMARERNGLRLLAAAGRRNAVPAAPSRHAARERAT
jgi:hypothetical protein